MFRMWAKIFDNNHMIKDFVYESSDYSISRTKRVFNGLDEVCHEFDLSVPMWLDKNIKEFKRVDKTRFYADNFIDSIDFSYLEIHIIEE